MKRSHSPVPIRHWTRTSLFWFLALVASCAEAETEVPAVMVQDSAGITIVTSDLERTQATCRISEAPTLSIGTVEGLTEYELYRVFGARQLSDGRIALVNQGSNELRFYDADGRYLRSAGREGMGPGEFQRAFHLWVLPGDTIYVGDYRPWEFEVFSPDGRWVRRIQPAPPYNNVPGVLAILSDGRMVLAEREFLHAPINRFEPRFLTVVLHGPDGVLTDTIGRYAHGSVGMFEEWPSFIANPMFESSSRVAAADRRIYVGHTSTAEFQILEVADEGQVGLERIVRWTAISERVSAADVEAERARLAEPFADAQPEMRQQLLGPQITDRRPVASHFPIFSSLHPATDGRIWVRSFRRPRSDPLDEWLVFDASGALECRIALPRFAQVLELGGDFMLVLDRDELGVERVLRYAVGR